MLAQEERSQEGSQMGSLAEGRRLWVKQCPVRGDEAHPGAAERQSPVDVLWRCWLGSEPRDWGADSSDGCSLVHGLILGTCT